MSKVTYINLTTDDVTKVISEIESSNILPATKQILTIIVKNYTWLQLKLEQGRVTFKILRKILLGFISEKNKSVRKNLNALDNNITNDQLPKNTDPSIIEKNKEISDPDNTPATNKAKSKKPGHGRNSAAKYTGAENIIILNELSAGQLCPVDDCTGKLYNIDPSTVVRLVSKGLFNAVGYSLISLRCALCGTVFRAKLPEEAGINKYSANNIAWLNFYKYYAGLPFKRIETIQNLAGIPFPDATQWQLIYGSYMAVVPVLEHMTYLAGEAELMHADDTRGNIINIDKPDELKDTDRKAIYTTGIVAKYQDYLIYLYITGNFYAGENVGNVLKNRQNTENLIYMTDALASMNTPKNISDALLAKIIMVYCLVHGRRQFLRLIEIFPKKAQYVLDLISKIYQNEKYCKDHNFNHRQRLLYHQEHSSPILDEWHAWLKKQFEDKLVEPNSSLGKAIKYVLRHWHKLTQFIRVEGSPIDNNIVEMSLRIPIRLRKSSYFYKTKLGAAAGDCMMSLIYTCISAKQNPIEYLTQLQINSASVAKNPSLWLPWNFKNQLSLLATA